MFLKRFGLGLTIALALLIVAACGGNKKKPTPQAATATPGRIRSILHLVLHSRFTRPHPHPATLFMGRL